MTETEWLASRDPFALAAAGGSVLSGRRQYLLAHAICWRVRGLLIDPNTLLSLAVIEAFADGGTSPDDLRRAANEAVESWDEFELTTAFDEAQRHAVYAVTQAATDDDPVWSALDSAVRAVEARGTHGTVVPAFADLVREVVGNPFRPVEFEPAWRTSDVMLLARGIYAEKAFDRMPILADALQDAGCDREELLAHCRDPGQVHVRGCWALDLVLGK